MPRESVRLRNKSTTNSQERRNSVGDITDYFQTQISQMAHQNKKPNPNFKQAIKEKNKELREIKDNIKAMIENDNLPNKEGANANGADQSDSMQDKHADQSAEIAINPSPLNEGDLEERTFSSRTTQTSEDEILKALAELAQKYDKLDKDIHDPKNGVVNQLASTQGKVADLYTDIHGAVGGLKVRMDKVTISAEQNSNKISQMENNQARMSALLDENKRLVQELKTMQGLVHKVQQQANMASNQILDLTKRGMEQNLIVHGIDDTLEKEDPKRETPMFTFRERPKHAVLQFLKDILNIDIGLEDIWKAHRMGPSSKDKVRPMVIKVSYGAKELIMEHVSKLKGKTNPKTKQVLFISEQIPEGVTENKKQTASRLKTLKDNNDKKPVAERNKLQVIGDKILVDGVVDEPEVVTPLPSQLFPSIEKQKRIDAIQAKMIETEPLFERNSEFKAISLRVHSIEEVNLAYIAVAQRYPISDHISVGYALREGHQVKSGFCDDREYGAGTKIKNIIFDQKSKNTAVFVLRKYGGVHLGFNRFQIIESATKEAIRMLNASP